MRHKLVQRIVNAYAEHAQAADARAAPGAPPAGRVLIDVELECPAELRAAALAALEACGIARGPPERRAGGRERGSGS